MHRNNHLFTSPDYKEGLKVILFAVFIAWGIELLDHIPLINLDKFGIHPRKFKSLFGILAMPWLHGSFGHLIANTIPFISLATLVLLTEKERFYLTTFKIILVAGLGTWLIGRPNSVHIGASSLIYGYFGYLLMRSYLEKKVTWFLLGAFLLYAYGHLIFGILPSCKKHISWEGHLAGLISGLWIARLLKTKTNDSTLSKTHRTY